MIDEGVIFDKLVSELHELVSSNSDFIASGRCDTYHSYTGVAGKITGYKDCIVLVKEMKSDFFSDELDNG